MPCVLVHYIWMVYCVLWHCVAPLYIEMLSLFVYGSSVSKSLTKRVRTFTLEMTVPSVDVFQLHCDPSDTQHHHSQTSLALECQVVGLVSWWPFRTICGTWTLQRLLDSECLTPQSHILPSQSFQWNGNISYESAMKWMSCFQEPIFGWRGLFFALLSLSVMWKPGFSIKDKCLLFIWGLLKKHCFIALFKCYLQRCWPIEWDSQIQIFFYM
jgi:hypothetical protein